MLDSLTFRIIISPHIWIDYNNFSPHIHEKQCSTRRQHHKQHVKVNVLKERSLGRLSIPIEYESSPNSNLPNEMLQALPNEVLMHIFSFLDDISLYAVGNVCRRWHQLLVSQTTSEQWKTYTRRRWPLYKPLCPVSDWFAIYSHLVSIKVYDLVDLNF